MLLNMIGAFVRNAKFGTEVAFAKGLRRIGVEVNEIDPSVDIGLDKMKLNADATIVFKDCDSSNPYLERLSGPIVVYQPDDARFQHIRESMLAMRPYATMFLSFDDFGSQIAQAMGYKSEVMLLTADDEVYKSSETNIERDIDVSFIGCFSNEPGHVSRHHMINTVRKLADTMNWKVVFGTTFDIPAIVNIYQRSKVVINHATDVGQKFGTGFGVQCRHFEVGMTKTCLLSNFCLSNVDLCDLQFSKFSSEEELISSIKMLIEHKSERDYYADELYAGIKRSHMPEHRALQIIDFIKRNS